MRILVVAVVFSMIIPSMGFAGDPPWCYDELAASCSLRISVCPQGDFERIAEGCGGSDDYIEVIIRDADGQPIAGIPTTDFWMNACDPAHELCVCAAYFEADSLTGSNGRTTFSGRIAAGGCIPSGGICVACQGITILDSATCTMPVCLDIVIVSPDINGDCFVNSSDLSFFGQSYNKATGEPLYNDCCDYTDDGICNLIDFSFFAKHYQHGCQ